MLPLPAPYHFTPEEMEICKKHAEDVTETTIYAIRNGQTNKTKRIEDALVGKLAEFLTFELLHIYYPTLTKPDVEIYSGRRKSWKPDLETQDFYISVKGQNTQQGKRYGVSWIFERTDSGLKPKDKPTYLSLVSIDLENSMGYLQALINLEKAVFGELKVEWLRATKKAIYFKDLGSDLCQLE
jgi:hypothetical protein